MALSYAAYGVLNYFIGCDGLNYGVMPLHLASSVIQGAAFSIGKSTQQPFGV